jgi:hypothetical protein
VIAFTPGENVSYDFMGTVLDYPCAGVAANPEATGNMPAAGEGFAAVDPN